MNTHESHGEHHGPSDRAYLLVFVALAVFTAVSFVCNSLARSEAITPHTSFAIILGVAVIKAALVVTYFMHLIVDYRKIGFLLIVAFILATMMMVVFMPDGVLAWR